MKFKVGDIVTGKEDAPYGITTKNATMEVIQIISIGSIQVKIIKHKTMEHHVGSIYPVKAKHFEKVISNPLVEFKTMDIKQPIYWECKINCSNKFWAAHIIEEKVFRNDGEDGVNVRTKYILIRKWGKIDTNGQTMEQEFDDMYEAERVLKNLIWEKERKGYKPVF